MQADCGWDDSPWIVSTGEQAPEAVEVLLATVPEWFGIAESNLGYVEAARHLPTYLARPRLPDQLASGTNPVGVLLAARHLSADRPRRTRDSTPRHAFSLMVGS